MEQIRSQAASLLDRAGIIEGAITITPSTIDSSTRQVSVDIQVNFTRNSGSRPYSPHYRSQIDCCARSRKPRLTARESVTRRVNPYKLEAQASELPQARSASK